MALNQEELVLIGDDCQIFTGKLSGTPIVGDGTATLGKKGMYVITKKAEDTFFPTGLNVGDLLPADGTEVLKTGDEADILVLKESGDASGWSLALTSDKIDTSRLRDKIKKYRYGKKDATGTINSLFTMGVTDVEGGSISQSMKIVQKDKEGTYTVITPDDQALYFLGYIRKSETVGEVEDFVFAQINMSDVTLGGSSGSAQSYDSSFSLTGADPVLYSVEVV